MHCYSLLGFIFKVFVVYTMICIFETNFYVFNYDIVLH